MQTFLPYPNFSVSMMHLDWQRLGKQRSEARIIQSAIQKVRELGGVSRSASREEYLAGVKKAEASLGSKIGWASHPATLQWVNHLPALMLYGDCAIREWVRRGYNNTMSLMCTSDFSNPDVIQEQFGVVEMPPWLGDEEFHASHRAALLFKHPEWYGKFGWVEKPEYNYKWV